MVLENGPFNIFKPVYSLSQTFRYFGPLWFFWVSWKLFFFLNVKDLCDLETFFKKGVCLIL